MEMDGAYATDCFCSDDDVVDEGDLCTCLMSLYYGKVVSYADKKEDGE